MRKGKTLIAAALAGALSGAALAHDFSYNWVELSGGTTESDSADGDNRALGLSVESETGLLFGVNIGNTEYDELFGSGLTSNGVRYEVDSLGFNIGGAGHGADSSTWMRLGYTTFEGDSNDPWLDSVEGDAVRAAAGVRTWLVPSLEGWLSGGFERQDAEIRGFDSDPENSWLLGAGLRAYLAPEVSLGAGVTRQFFDDDDVTGVNAQLRFHF